MALTLEEFSDRELLFAFEEHADANGTISSRELSDGLSLSGLKNPHMNVAIRLGWLKRYGIVYRDPDTGRWALTTAGTRLLHGGLRKRESSVLEGMEEHSLLAAMDLFGARIIGAGGEAATMASRQWRYAVAQRKARTR
jgi:hypothetical protein